MESEAFAADRVSRVREAIEQVAGRSLSLVWPADALPPGTRVRVVQDGEWNGPWQTEFFGVVDTVGAPESNDHMLALPGELKYWVRFDELQYGHAGDGPYRGAQIWGRYVLPVADREP